MKRRARRRQPDPPEPAEYSAALRTELERIDKLMKSPPPGRTYAIVGPVMKKSAIHRLLHVDTPDSNCGWCGPHPRLLRSPNLDDL